MAVARAETLPPGGEESERRDEGGGSVRVHGDSNIVALQSALANVIAQRRAIRADTSFAKDDMGCAGPSPPTKTMYQDDTWSDSQQPSSSFQTPEAIRTSRSLRQHHETTLARFASECADDEVRQRMQALQQRRRELTRALEHLEVVQMSVPQTNEMGLEKPISSPEDKYTQQDEEDKAEDSGTREATDTCAKGQERLDIFSRIPDTSQDHVNESRAESSCMSGYFELEQDSEEESVCDVLDEAGSFDVLVQNLLHVSLSDDAGLTRESEAAKSGEQCRHEAMSTLGQLEPPLPLHHTQSHTIDFLSQKDGSAAGKSRRDGAGAGKLPYIEFQQQKDVH